VLASAASADALVLAAPIYYGYPSGLFKSCLDRWYSFRDGQRQLRTPQDRPALLILTQGHPDPDAYAWTAESLRKTLTAYGLTPQVLVAPALEGPDDADRSPELLAEARRLGSLLRR
jgi:NAD(P)H-dependent FMN reductase